EAELFGAERGAYTGADKKRIGLIGSAEGGTLFLDEIGEVPLNLQAKLLRFLESREYRPLGSTTERHFQGRVVTATNKDLQKEVEAGRFREDLLYRLDVFTVRLPSLRERKDDIPEIFEGILRQMAKKYDREVPHIKPGDLERLKEYDFPGNVRELRNVIERSLLRSDPSSRWLTLDSRIFSLEARVPVASSEPVGGQRPEASATLPEGLSTLEAQEFNLIRETLIQTNGGIRRAAASLGLTPQSLLRRLQKWPELREIVDAEKNS
ncbi:sigma 54-interacting transcriptional regulator, partial [Candidatus Rhodobacter oscarellae]|uniref:sigma 54-interacting transcriptional regulator n=1 Tax=Candidatus Rhodobacter oscarellae TaxID=1675527 RepID=UPI000670BF3D